MAEGREGASTYSTGGGGTVFEHVYGPPGGCRYHRSIVVGLLRAQTRPSTLGAADALFRGGPSPGTARSSCSREPSHNAKIPVRVRVEFPLVRALLRGPSHRRASSNDLAAVRVRKHPGHPRS